MCKVTWKDKPPLPQDFQVNGDFEILLKEVTLLKTASIPRKKLLTGLGISAWSTGLDLTFVQLVLAEEGKFHPPLFCTKVEENFNYLTSKRA